MKRSSGRLRLFEGQNQNYLQHAVGHQHRNAFMAFYHVLFSTLSSMRAFLLRFLRTWGAPVGTTPSASNSLFTY